jgi:hypothetical protein
MTAHFPGLAQAHQLKVAGLEKIYFANSPIVSYKKQKLLTLRKHLRSPRVFCDVCVANFFSFCCPIIYLNALNSALCCPLRFPSQNNVRLPSCRRANVLFTLFVFVCIKLCLTHIVLCFCVVFLHLVYHVLPGFSRLSIVWCSQSFTLIVYLYHINICWRLCYINTRKYKISLE